jgi:hypothetical protein
MPQSRSSGWTVSRSSPSMAASGRGSDKGSPDSPPVVRRSPAYVVARSNGQSPNSSSARATCAGRAHYTKRRCGPFKTKSRR